MARTATPFTNKQRRLRGQIAINTRWANASAEDRAEQGARGQAGLLARFERQVDPGGELEPAERARRAGNAYQAHMARLALASSNARAARKAGAGDAS
jgi:hypothetical protein